MSERFDRQERFFGKEGQAKLGTTILTIVGTGGLGTHVVQQSALLGVGRITVIDSEELAKTDRNRYVTAQHDDPIPGSFKVDLAERLIHRIDPTITVGKVPDSFISEEGFAAIKAADVVIGCLDTEGARLVLNELCVAYGRQYIDLATDIIPGETLSYGGRVCVSWSGAGCLVCHGLLDWEEAQRDLAGEAERATRERIYGVRRSVLDAIGPSVVTINGVVASLGMTEFMAAVTSLRPPVPVLTYHGNRGIVTRSSDMPAPDCYYCCGIRGKLEAADVERYLRSGVGTFLR